MEHITKDNFVSDEQLLVLLDCKEAGKSFPDALTAISGSAFSHEETKVLKSLWDMHSDLMREAHNLSPNRALLSRIVEQSGVVSDAHVTTSSDQGYTQHGAKDNVISVHNNFYSIMQMNWKIGTPIAIVVIAVVLVMSMGGKDTGQLAVNNTEITQDTAASAQPMTMAMKVASPPVSGSIDDLVATLNSEGDGDLLLTEGSVDDAALITVDSQSVNDFNTAYDETTF